MPLLVAPTSPSALEESMSERTFSPEQVEFRDYCRRWIAENRPAAPSFRLPLSPIG